MNTESNININGEMMRVRAEEMKMCAVTIGNTQYIAPQAVAKLIADLADQLRVEQQRRRKDDEDILRFIKKHASYIAYNLGGGEKERVSGNPAFCGENLLKYPVDHQVPLPDGVEYDDGRKTQDFKQVVAERIYLALSRVRDMRGKMLEKLDGSEPSDPAVFS